MEIKPAPLLRSHLPAQTSDHPSSDQNTVHNYSVFTDTNPVSNTFHNKEKPRTYTHIYLKSNEFISMILSVLLSE